MEDMMVIKRIKDAGSQQGASLGWYECISCRTPHKVRDSRIKRGVSQICIACRDKCLGDSQRTHGESTRPLYIIWNSFKQKVDWPDYKSFKTWALASGYKEDLYIYRPDGNKPYGPNNTVWSKRRADALSQSKLQERSTSGYTGVNTNGHNATNPWTASLSSNGKRFYIGSYPDVRSAALARNKFITEGGFPHRLSIVK